MYPTKIENLYIELSIDLDGNITELLSGNFIEKEFVIGDSVFNTCPFLIGTLEALPLRESFLIEGMVVSSENKEYNVDLMDKMNVSYKQGEFIAHKSLLDFKKMAKQKAVSKNTIVFNRLLTKCYYVQ
mgnify:CR=1 FL=1